VISQKGKFGIGNYLEKIIKAKLHLADSGSKFFDACDVKNKVAYEIKVTAISVLHTPRPHGLGRIFLSRDEHERFKKLADEKGLKPFYLFGVYYFNARKPTLETVRIADWEFVDNFNKGGRAHFRIPLQVLGLLKEPLII
jgi:hypothetical protein